jgi:hypothetical protein
MATTEELDDELPEPEQDQDEKEDKKEAKAYRQWTFHGHLCAECHEPPDALGMCRATQRMCVGVFRRSKPILNLI